MSKTTYANKDGMQVTIDLPNGDKITGKLWGYKTYSYLEIEKIHDSADREQAFAVSMKNNDIERISIHAQRVFMSLYHKDYQTKDGIVHIEDITLSINKLECVKA